MIHRYKVIGLLFLVSSSCMVHAKQSYKQMSDAVLGGDVNRLTYLLNREGALDVRMKECLLIKAERETQAVLKSSSSYSKKFECLKFLAGSLLVCDTYKDLKREQVVVADDNNENQMRHSEGISIVPVMMKFFIAYVGYRTAKKALNCITVERLMTAQAIEALIKNASELPEEEACGL
ncbi:hypothetical protein H0X06_01130 [Candidatus Dependentiae bacterium]|nr:hypothetical protein [Candidatus Dependentiae bacterium]